MLNDFLGVGGGGGISWHKLTKSGFWNNWVKVLLRVFLTELQSLDLRMATRGLTLSCRVVTKVENITPWSGVFTPVKINVSARFTVIYHFKPIIDSLKNLNDVLSQIHIAVQVSGFYISIYQYIFRSVYYWTDAI